MSIRDLFRKNEPHAKAVRILFYGILEKSHGLGTSRQTIHSYGQHQINYYDSMIPKLHYISQGNSPAAHLKNIQSACNSGAELVQLRLKNISEKKILNLPMRLVKSRPTFRPD